MNVKALRRYSEDLTQDFFRERLFPDERLLWTYTSQGYAGVSLTLMLRLLYTYLGWPLLIGLVFAIITPAYWYVETLIATAIATLGFLKQITEIATVKSAYAITSQRIMKTISRQPGKHYAELSLLDIEPVLKRTGYRSGTIAVGSKLDGSWFDLRRSDNAQAVFDLLTDAIQTARRGRPLQAYTDPEEVLQDRLIAGESVLWRGRPFQLLAKRDLLVISSRFVLITGAADTLVHRSRLAHYSAAEVLLFLTILTIFVASYLQSKKRSKSTLFVLTDQRIIQATVNNRRPIMVEAALDTIRYWKTEEVIEDQGTVRFGVWSLDEYRFRGVPYVQSLSVKMRLEAPHIFEKNTDSRP